MLPVAAVAASIGVGFAGISAADTATSSPTGVAAKVRTMIGMHPREHGPGMGRGAGVMGTVTAVSGNTVTVTDKDGTTYTIDATSAEVSKTSTITVSQIAVGDTVGVQGTVSGTTVTAKHIMDGLPAGIGEGVPPKHDETTHQ